MISPNAEAEHPSPAPTHASRCTVQGMPKVALEVGPQNDMLHPGSYSPKRRANPSGEGVVEKNRSLDERLVSCGTLVRAYCSRSGKL